MVHFAPSARRASRGAIVLIVAVSGAAYAQTEQVQPPPDSENWRFVAGLGAISSPRYPGSDSTKTTAIPLLGASYGRYFIGGMPGTGVPVGIGAFLYRDATWRAGVGLGTGLGKAREESDDERLRGLGDIRQTARATLFGGYTVGWLNLQGNVATDVGGRHQGTLVSFDVQGEYRLSERISLKAGPGITWADRKYSQTFFGIDPDQSARSGRPQYDAGSGINALRFSVGAEIGLTERWNLGAQFTAARLRADAAASPITVDKNQNSYSLFASYRF